MENVAVEQADRDAAAPLFALYDAPNYAELCRRGSEHVDGLAIVQTLAAHRIAGQAELREALEQASEWVTLMWPQIPMHVRRNMADRYSAHRATVTAALSQSPSLNCVRVSEESLA